MLENKQANRVAPHPVLSSYYGSAEERRSRVDAMFDASAQHYDWITGVMSFGSGQWYRRQALLRAGLQTGMSVLDVGAGTGVVTWLAQEIVGQQGTVIALDPSKGMLSEAQKAGVKLATQGLGEKLPFPDNSFDRLTMGYALRHVADLTETFAEYRRVLKPGGRILLLEITKPASGLYTQLLKAYMKGVVPLLARFGRRSVETQTLMRYYWDTIEQCVPPATIVSTLKDVGLVDVHRHVVMGLFSEYNAVKLAPDS